MIAGTMLIHKTLGNAVVQELKDVFHPHHRAAGLCYIKLDKKPDYFSTDVILAFNDDLKVIKELQ